MTMLKQARRCPRKGCRKVLSRKWRKIGVRVCNRHDL